MTQFRVQAGRWLLAALVFAYLLVGMIWTVANLGDVPHYGDTPFYLQFSEDLKVNEHRGIVYPWILAQTVALVLDHQTPRGLGPSQDKTESETRRCIAPAGFRWLQLLQVLASGVGLAYFLCMVMPSDRPNEVASRSSRFFKAATLLLLLLFDPLIQHFNLSLMTDSLSLVGCLVFCGGLTALADRRRLPCLHVALVCAGFLLASGLRIEKKWVLLATLLMTVVAWQWLRPRSVGGRRGARGLRLRLLSVSVLVVGGLVFTTVVHRHAQRPSNIMSSYESLIHFRIGLRHLTELYDQLPERSREHISKSDAEHYDTGVNGVRQVVYRLGNRDAPARQEFLDDVLDTVLPRRWGFILLGCGRAVLENTFSTISMYGHIAAWEVGGEGAMTRWFTPAGNVWNHQRMIFHHPQLSQLYLGLSVLLLVVALPLALRQWSRERPALRRLWRWVPSVAFVVANAAFFAAAFNYINFRYALFAHVLLLVFAYRPVVGLLWVDRSRQADIYPRRPSKAAPIAVLL